MHQTSFQSPKAEALDDESPKVGNASVWYTAHGPEQVEHVRFYISKRLDYLVPFEVLNRKGQRKFQIQREQTDLILNPCLILSESFDRHTPLIVRVAFRCNRTLWQKHEPVETYQ